MSRPPMDAPAGAGAPANRSFSARLGRRAARGDHAAFETIFERYHQELYRYCLAIVHDRQDAEDALQATMAAALRSLPGEERDIPLRPWLFRVAHNESVSLLRARKPTSDPEDVALEAAGSVAGEAEGRERLRQLVTDLQSLPERQRSAIVMRELNDVSYAEIGATLGSSEAAARQTVYEARTALFAFEEGRSMDCEPVREAISSRDGRRLRGRKVRAHLRVCEGCRDFEAVIAQRRTDLQALCPPLPALAASGMLAGLVGGGGGAAVVGAGAAGAGAGAAGVGGAGLFGSGVAGGLAIKGASLIAATAVAAGAADLGGVIDLPIPFGGSNTAKEGPSPPGESGSSQSGAGEGGTSAGAAGSSKDAGGAGAASHSQAGGKHSGAGNGNGGRGGETGNSGSAPGHSGASPGKSESAPGQTGASPGKSESAPGHGGTSPGNSGSAPGQTGSSPGKSESAPGHSGSSPGNSGSAPGQTGTSPGKSGSAPGQSSDAPGSSGSAPGQTKPSGSAAVTTPEPPSKPEPPVKPTTPATGGPPPGKATGNPHGDGEFTTGEFTAETNS